MKILVADDERQFARALRRVLEKRGYSVDLVYDGEEALGYLSVSKVDVILLDIMMPRLSGTEVIKRLRDEGNDTPVIFLTAKGSYADKVVGLNLGADDFIVKPFDFEELLARIRAVTRRYKGVAKNRLRVGETYLDLDAMELSHGDNSVQLSHKEFLLMEIFFSYPERVHSTSALLEGAWTSDANVDFHSVWTYLYALRHKLEDIGSDLTINSMRGAGYTLRSNAKED